MYDVLKLKVLVRDFIGITSYTFYFIVETTVGPVKDSVWSPFGLG